MPAAAMNNTTTVLGVQFSSIGTLTTDGSRPVDPIIPAAKTGVLTTRTDNDTGTFTMDSGHGFVTSDDVDVFWNGGYRRGMTATVTGDSVVLDGGSGDNLPAATTVITAMKPQEEEFPVTTANMQFLGVTCPAPAVVVFLDDEDAEVFARYVSGPEDAYQWRNGVGSNPFGDDVVAARFSHGSSAGPQKVTALALVN